MFVNNYPTVAHGEQPCLRGKKSQGSPDGSFSLTTSSKMVSAFFPGYGAVRRPLGRRLHWLWSLTALFLFRETWSYGLSRRCWWLTHQFLTQYPRRENHWRRPADPTFGDRVITQIFRLLLFLGLSVIQQDVRRSVATNLKWSAGNLENSPDYAECWRVHVSSTRVIFMLDKSTPLCRR